MKIIDFIKDVKGEILTNLPEIDAVEIQDAYVSDLLSDVMGSVGENMAWITIMRHLNVVAVASLAGIPIIIFSKGIIPAEPVVEKANEEGIHLVSSSLTTFQLAGMLYRKIHG
ncbi:MAG: hypothetical protein R6U84_00660 [Candidatus Cloacimonadales bacterium]